MRHRLSAAGLAVGLTLAGVLAIAAFVERGEETSRAASMSNRTAGASGASSSTAIAAAPAFSARDLTPRPTTGWLTNGGDLTNARYSPLKSIDTTNVSRLKGVWMTHLRKSGVEAKY